MSQTQVSPFERSVETERIVSRLLECEIGDVVTDEEWGRMLGTRPVFAQTEQYSAITRAVHVLQRDYGRFFDRVEKLGWQRISDAQFLEGKSLREQRKAAKRLRRNLRGLQSVDRSKLTDEQKKKHEERLAHAAILTHVTRESNLRKIASATQPKLPDVNFGDLTGFGNRE